MISQAYAMASPPADGQKQPSSLQMFAPLILIFFIFYFLMLRPQKKKEMEHRKFLESLKKGDEVVTQSGIYGKVAGIADKIVTLEVGDKVKIKILKSAIAGQVALPAEGSN